MLHNNYLLGYCKEAEIFIKKHPEKEIKDIFDFMYCRRSNRIRTSISRSVLSASHCLQAKKTIGNAFAWIFAPLGFATWKSAVATVTGLIAKEDVVGTFGVLLGEEFDEENVRPLAVKVAEMFGTREIAVSFMWFNLLSDGCCSCSSCCC